MKNTNFQGTKKPKLKQVYRMYRRRITFDQAVC